MSGKEASPNLLCTLLLVLLLLFSCFIVVNISTFLQGDPDISNNLNSLIFKAIQDLIAQSGRITIEYQTPTKQLLAYEHSLSVCLSVCLSAYHKFGVLMLVCSLSLSIYMDKHNRLLETDRLC